MLDKQGYTAYLARKKSSDKLTDERIGLLDRFNAIIAQNGITEIERIGEVEIVELMRPWNVSGRRNFLHNIAKFLNDYVAYIRKENHAQLPLADFIENYYRSGFEAYGKSAAERRRENILLAPAEFTVNPEYLSNMDNARFVDAFKELQEFVARCYEDIERAPFEWGYPDYETTDGYYNRVMDILVSIGLHGTYADRGITVDGTKFFANSLIKRNKKIELMVKGFVDMGLHFEGFGKKAQSFRVFYPDNPDVIEVLCAYMSNIVTSLPEKDWAWGKPFHSLSYRFVEDTATQNHNRLFLAEMDYASETMREIGEWLYAEAGRYGFSLDPKEWMEKDCMLYKKGSKRFLLVRNGDKGVESKTIFRTTLTDKRMEALYAKFPETFAQSCGYCNNRQNKPCSMRIEHTLPGKTVHNCAYHSFWFKGITLDDAKAILELFVVENKLKPIK